MYGNALHARLSHDETEVPFKRAFVYAAAAAFRLKRSSCMFGYQKNGIYCS
jgi:hypothetical protein